ncbi:MAG: transglycosylase domain-containing protein [Balneolaceae bacterium]
MTKKRQASIRKNQRKGFQTLLKLVSAIFAIVLGFIGLIYFGVLGPVPDYSELKDIDNQEASSVYSSDGKLIGRYFLQYRDRVNLEDVAPGFIDALLAIEDIRFYEHKGLDFRAMGRVMVRTLLLREEAGGGSTLSQQLAKNLYPRKGSSLYSLVVNKIREIIIAHRLERLYSKQEILELYINTVSFGEDTWGIRTASERFFNAPPDQLQLHQAATLAGMLRATTYYNPRRNPDHALQRRNLVLQQMERYGMIEPEDMEKAQERPLDLEYIRYSQSEGNAPHFREYIKSRIQQILDNFPALDGRHYDLYTDGLVIETTLDSRIQEAAEQSIQSTLAGLQRIFDAHQKQEPVFDAEDPMVVRAWHDSRRYQRLKQRGTDDREISNALDEPVSMDLFTWEGMKSVTATPRDSIRHYLSFLNAGFLAMHPSSGDVLAWVGSIQPRYFQYDHVRSRRPTGSAFKPVVYASSLESGVRPCDYRRNLLSTYLAYDDWTPSNLQEEYGGYYSIQAALARSVNTISVELLMENGIDNVRSTARRMGIHSPIPGQPSIALGTAELSLLELTRAYTTFLNRGTPATPRFIKAIYNADGTLIYEFPSHSPPGELAISEETASAILAILAKSVENGSASPLRTQFGIRHAVAGKTGTHQNFTDGWFIGMIPDMVFGTWVGGASPQVRLPENIGFASRNALPVSGTFLQKMSQNPELESISENFHAHQQNHSFATNCEDYRDERFTDRVRDFFTGRDSKDAQIVEEESKEEKDGEDKNLIDRIRGWFTKD